MSVSYFYHIDFFVKIDFLITRRIRRQAQNLFYEGVKFPKSIFVTFTILHKVDY